MVLKVAVNCIQCLAAIFYTTPGAVLCYMVWEVSDIIVLKIKYLKELFKDAFAMKDKEERATKFRKCVYFHQHILR